MNLLRSFAAAALVALSISTAATAQQDYPNRPITWIVPFAPGGVTDSAARFTAKSLGERLGPAGHRREQAGRRRHRRIEYVANAKPDGYTVLYASSGPMSTIPATRKTMSYDPVKSFTPLYGMAASPLVMVIAADKPYKTFAEFVEHAKKNPGKLNFASIGTAAAQHLTGELFAMGTKTDVVHIPYKATPAALADIHVRHHRLHVGFLDRHEAVDRRRQAARAGGQRHQAAAEPARRADHGRARLSGDRVQSLVHRGDAERRAAARRRQIHRRLRRGDEGARHDQVLRRHRLDHPAADAGREADRVSDQREQRR